MSFREPLDRLLTKDVDRREFLTHIGAAGLGIIGITSLLKALNDSQSKTTSSGYGSSAYGGGDSKVGIINRHLS